MKKRRKKPPAGKPKVNKNAKSYLEEMFAKQLEEAKAPEAVRQLKFCSHRKWQADFAWPDHMLIVEIDGGLWSRGRHLRPDGYARDAEKRNWALLHGWLFLNFVPDVVKNGYALEVVLEALGERGCRCPGCGAFGHKEEQPEPSDAIVGVDPPIHQRAVAVHQP